MNANQRTLNAGLLLVTGLFATASADTITVCLDGSCDFTDPAAASAVAVTGDVIEIAAGTYLLEEPVALYAQDVDIRGAVDAQGAPATILDGQDKGQVFGGLHISDEVVFENLVLTDDDLRDLPTNPGEDVLDGRGRLDEIVVIGCLFVVHCSQPAKK